MHSEERGRECGLDCEVGDRIDSYLSLSIRPWGSPAIGTFGSRLEPLPWHAILPPHMLITNDTATTSNPGVVRMQP